MEKRTIERYKNLISIRISSRKPSFFEVNIKSPEISLRTNDAYKQNISSLFALEMLIRISAAKESVESK